MAWFLRAVEVDAKGIWACRQGRTEIDQHACLGHALDHLRELAAKMSTPVEIYLHPIEGDVVRHELR